MPCSPSATLSSAIRFPTRMTPPRHVRKRIHAALTAARSFIQNPRALDSLSRHESRMNRMYTNTLKELQQVQAARRERERVELIRAANLYKTAQMKGLTYKPENDGFVLTNTEIEEY